MSSPSEKILPSAARPAGGGRGLLLLAFIVTALTLRSPLTAIAPIVNDLRAGLAIGSGTTGLLTSIPVLCFGVLTPLASLVIGRTSIETSVFMTLGGAAAGLVLRSSGGVGCALAGTLVLGASLTIGNIVSLMIIARDFPDRSRIVTGLYTSALNVGTMLSSAMTAPLAQWAGWRIALAGVVLLVIPAIGLWVAVIRLRPAPSAPRGRMAGGRTADGPPEKRARGPAAVSHSSHSLWRRPVAVLLMAAFAAHLTVYYSMTAWLPAYLMQATAMPSTTAGLVASLFQILALTGSFGVPALAGRIALSRLLCAVAICWMVTPPGFLFAPEAWPAWCVTGGIASGGGFTAIFMLIMAHARDLRDNLRMSALVQGGGYSLSSAGPLIIGGLHQASGGWTAGFLVLVVSAGILLACGIGAGRIGVGPSLGAGAPEA